ncbi:hypothetical protein CsSME_00044025 [Camellia sinensis var. sinensis]
MYAALSVEVECFDPTLAHQGEKNRGLAQRLPIFTGSSESFRALSAVGVTRGGKWMGKFGLHPKLD